MNPFIANGTASILESIENHFANLFSFLKTPWGFEISRTPETKEQL